ncbi:hypothetical protein INT47_011550 [Mucor saturninus]|uniref:Uncharacterized protein n=2 Tax=Mucor TaxID=4830 RepID=A0A8H7QXB3_9FUNG|nr:hypothetical protein INT47_011550 [Mucor saturninus]
MLNVFQERHLPTAAYPLRGFAHFLHHPQRHAGPIGLSILKVFGTSALAIIPLYKYGYDIQRDVISILYRGLITDSPHISSILVAVTSSILFFLETSAITLQLGSHFVGSVRERLFDSVLKERKGMPGDNKVQVSEQVGGSGVTLNQHHFLSPMNLMILSAEVDESWSIYLLKPAIFVMTLPLNLVPVLGPLCFISIQALFTGGSAHRRYFQLYNWSPAQRQRRVETYFWQYERFGIVSSALEMIPFVGYVFMYTNQIG